MVSERSFDPHVRQLLTRQANRGNARLEERPVVFTWLVGEGHACDLVSVLRENDGHFHGLMAAVLESAGRSDEFNGLGIDELDRY